MEGIERERLEKAQQIAELRLQDLRREILSNKNALNQADAKLRTRQNKFKAVLKDLADTTRQKSDKPQNWQKLQYFKAQQITRLISQLKAICGQTRKEVTKCKTQGTELLDKFKVQKLKKDNLIAQVEKLKFVEQQKFEVSQSEALIESVLVRKQLAALDAEEVDSMAAGAQEERVHRPNLERVDNLGKSFQEPIFNSENFTGHSGQQYSTETQHLACEEDNDNKTSPNWQQMLEQVLNTEQLNIKTNSNASSVSFNWGLENSNLNVEVCDVGNKQVTVVISNTAGERMENISALKLRLQAALKEAHVEVKHFKVVSHKSD